MKAVIFNAPTTIDIYYTAIVRHDMPWLGKNEMNGNAALDIIKKQTNRDLVKKSEFFDVW